MERVVKRFLMHNQNDFDDTKQNEYDEFKQDLQLIRYEIINNFKKTREDNMRNMFCVNSGLEFLVNEITNNKSPSSQYIRYKELVNDSAINKNNNESEIIVDENNLKHDLTIIKEINDDEITKNIQESNKNHLDLKICINDIDRIEVSST